MGALAYIILISFFAGVFGTGLGGILACCFKRDSKRTISLLLSFAGGVMLSVVCFDLIQEAIKPVNASEQANIFLVILGILLGYLVVYLLNDLIEQAANRKNGQSGDKGYKAVYTDSGHTHYYQKNQYKPVKNQLFIAGLVMAFAIALHNFPEGMVIGAAYASEAAAGVISGEALILAFIIGLHDIPEGMAVSVPLISGGMSRIRAVLITCLSGLPTIIGAVAGYSIGMMSSFALSLALSFASGAMLYVVFGELLPEAIIIWRSKYPAFAVLAGIIVGLLIIYSSYI
jgi:ZIP family zinc transporter